MGQVYLSTCKDAFLWDQCCVGVGKYSNPMGCLGLKNLVVYCHVLVVDVYVKIRQCETFCI